MALIDIYVAPGEDIGFSLEDGALSINVIGVNDFKDEEVEDEDLECNGCVVCAPDNCGPDCAVQPPECRPGGCDAEKCCGGPKDPKAELRSSVLLLEEDSIRFMSRLEDLIACLRNYAFQTKD